MTRRSGDSAAATTSSGFLGRYFPAHPLNVPNCLSKILSFARVAGSRLRAKGRDARSLRARPEYQQREAVRSATAGGRPAREAVRCDNTCSDARAGVRADDHRRDGV